MSGDLRYRPGSDQSALASTFNKSLRGLLPLSRLHLAHEESDETWWKLESLGLFGIGVSEEEGGSGLGAVEEALIAMELGRCLAAPSVLATIGAMHVSRKDCADAEIRGRRAAAAFKRGKHVTIVEDHKADFVLVRSEGGTALYEGVVSMPLEERLWFTRLHEAISLPEPVASFEPSGLMRLRLLDAAALSGIAEVALDMSVSYALQREQFGRPIGSFQAVKHHCANMAIAARCAHDQTGFAAVAIDDGRSDAGFQVDCALLVAAAAALETSAKNIQIHGGIGLSDEANPHLLLKRAQILVTLAGGLEAAEARIADADVRN
ncbi:MAG: acyl-CoA dehydrogenase family protein [Steroidobacteraceae bacterium]